MKIKINNKKHEIPAAGLLTVSQYCDLMEFEKVSIIEYLAYFTGYSEMQIMKANISNEHLQSISNVIGYVKDYDYFTRINKLPEKIFFNGKEYDYNNLNDLSLSVGARILLTQFAKKEKQRKLDPVIYLLAIITNGSLDFESTNRTFEEIQNVNYVDAFKIAAFFFQRLAIQSTKGTNFLKRLKLKILILIAEYGKRLG